MAEKPCRACDWINAVLVLVLMRAPDVRAAVCCLRCGGFAEHTPAGADQVDDLIEAAAA